MKTLTWLLPQTPVTEDDLVRLRSVSNLALPEDFRLWLLKHNGACPEPSKIVLEDGLIVLINAFVSFSERDTPNALSILSMLKDRLPKGLVPIADDHGGNYVCFRHSSKAGDPDVVLWDHEEANPVIATKPIASSFTELIRLLGGAEC